MTGLLFYMLIALIIAVFAYLLYAGFNIIGSSALTIAASQYLFSGSVPLIVMVIMIHLTFRLT